MKKMTQHVLTYVLLGLAAFVISACSEQNSSIEPAPVGYVEPPVGHEHHGQYNDISRQAVKFIYEPNDDQTHIVSEYDLYHCELCDLDYRIALEEGVVEAHTFDKDGSCTICGYPHE